MPAGEQLCRSHTQPTQRDFLLTYRLQNKKVQAMLWPVEGTSTFVAETLQRSGGIDLKYAPAKLARWVILPHADGTQGARTSVCPPDLNHLATVNADIIGFVPLRGIICRFLALTNPTIF